MMKGHRDIVKYFIEEKGLDPEVKGRYMRTPLHWAAYSGRMDVVEYLVSKGE